MLLLRIYVFLVTLTSFSFCDNYGVKMRLTTKGMDYVVKVGIDIMKKDLKKMKISRDGAFKNGYYNITNLAISKFDFGSYRLNPVKGIGMKGMVSDISMKASANLHFKYHTWFGTYADSTRFHIQADGIDFMMTLKIGSEESGHPSISVQECKANIGNIELWFDGGLSFIYNLISPFISVEMESTFKDTLCKLAIAEINTKAKEELESFPVVRKIDSFAEIDYRLTEAPIFTTLYMDVLLKGEFKHSTKPKESNFPILEMLTNSDHSKMVYFWISDYTLNTAGQVYHEAEKLNFKISANDPKAPAEIKSLLQTNKFAILFPKIILDYPNKGMNVHVFSYQPPHVSITEKEANFHLFALVKFSVKSKDLFTFKFDIKAGATIGVRKTNVTAKIDYFSYKAYVQDSIYGQPTISLDNKFIETLVDTFVIKIGNNYISQGFPLPKVSDVTFNHFNVKLIQDAIRIGTDLKLIERSKKLR